MSDWWEETEKFAEAEKKEHRTLFEIGPLRNALAHVVDVAKRHRTAGLDDDIVAVGRICQAALTWQKLDEQGKFEEAEKWLIAIPHPAQT